MNIGKRQVEFGGVLLRKAVRTETVNRPVQLRREELVIERVPGSGRPVDGNAEFAEREVFIPLLREEPVIQKDVVLKKVINVGKSSSQEQETVNANLREEELQMLRQGDAQKASGGPASPTQGGGSEAQQRQQQPGQGQQGSAGSGQPPYGSSGTR